VDEVAAALMNDVKTLVMAHLDGIPHPVDGKDVTREDIEKVLEPITDRWALNFERRMTDLLQRLADKVPVPKDGLNGKDGADGLGFDDMSFEYDGRRTFALVFERGDQRIVKSFKMPVMIEAGIYVRGKAYEHGDCVTWGGNYWTALKDTSNQPGDNNDDWRLVVRKGRDGKRE
jgi:integrin beta 3